MAIHGTECASRTVKDLSLSEFGVDLKWIQRRTSNLSFLINVFSPLIEEKFNPSAESLYASNPFCRFSLFSPVFLLQIQNAHHMGSGHRINLTYTMWTTGIFNKLSSRAGTPRLNQTTRVSEDIRGNREVSPTMNRRSSRADAI